MGLAFNAMDSHQSLWNWYFNDVITHKLELMDPSTPQGDLAHQIWNVVLEKIHDHSRIPERVVDLHCTLNVDYLELARYTAIIRPLGKLEEVSGKMKVD